MQIDGEPFVLPKSADVEVGFLNHGTILAKRDSSRTKQPSPRNSQVRNLLLFHCSNIDTSTDRESTAGHIMLDRSVS